MTCSRCPKQGISADRCSLLPRAKTALGQTLEVTHVLRNGGKGVVSGHWLRPDQGPSSPNSIATQRLDQTRLGSRQQFREHGKVAATSRCDPERCIHVDPDHVAARRQPHLSLAGEQHFPGLMLLLADQGVLAIGAALSVGSGRTVGAGQAVISAGSAIFGPSSRLKVPAAEGRDPFFAAFSST